MHLGYLAALGTLFCWTVSVFVLARLARIRQPGILNKASLLYSALVLGVVVCLADHITPIGLFQKPDKEQWLWLGLSGILGKSIGDYLGYSCIRILGVRRRSMITTITPACTWFFAFQFLGETINTSGLAGIGLTMLSLFLLYRDQNEQKEVQEENYGSFLKGSIMGVAGAILTGLAFVLSKKAFPTGFQSISAFHGTWIRVTVALAGIWLFELFRTNREKIPSIFPASPGVFGLLSIAVVFGTVLGLSLSLVAVTRLPVAVAYTLFSLVPLMVILVQTISGRKIIHWKNWLYALLAILGVCLLMWRNHL